MTSYSAQNFQHEPLPDSTCIRLLKIKPARKSISCTLERFLPKDCPGYTALSYTWGDDTLRNEIHINDHRYMIHDNLQRFLSRSLEANFDGYLWTDSLCLDQANKEELNTQITRMAGIYEGAEKVAIWLGDDPDLIQELQSGTYRLALRSPYWKRVWIIQEMAFARQLTVVYGPHEVGFAELKSSMRDWMSTG